MFTDPAARKVYVDWEKEAADMLGRFRATRCGRPAAGPKHLHHPALGDVVFKHAVLQVADHAEQTLVYFTTTEVPESKLADLAAEIG